MKVNTFDDFTTNMGPHIGQVSPNLRKSLLRGLYALAEGKAKLEDWKDDSQEIVPQARKAIGQFRRVKAHLSRAIAHVKSARNALDPSELKYHFGLEFDTLAEMMIEDLRAAEAFEKQEVGLIHPDLRTTRERAIFHPPEDESFTYPGSGVYVSDYRFIKQSGRLLGRIRTTAGKPLRTADSNRIIAATFQAAFGETCSEFRIKTARRRLKGRRGKASKCLLKKAPGRFLRPYFIAVTLSWRPEKL